MMILLTRTLAHQAAQVEALLELHICESLAGRLMLGGRSGTQAALGV